MLRVPIVPIRLRPVQQKLEQAPLLQARPELQLVALQRALLWFLQLALFWSLQQVLRQVSARAAELERAPAQA